jgi:DNA-binding transcriptional MocR family regulator
MTTNWKPRLEGENQSLYLSIVQALADDISSGVLVSETRLPTHRELAKSLGVAIGTITRAYMEAEMRGLVHSEGRRGTFVGKSRTSWLGQYSPLEPTPYLVNLHYYYPFFGDDPDLAVALRRLARRSSIQSVLHYGPWDGLLRHHETGALWIKKLGLEVNPESVVMTSGAQHAIYVILSSVLQKGDIVLADSHSYPNFRGFANLLGLRLIGVPTDEKGMLPDELESICASREVGALYCNPTIHNPTTATMTENRRQFVAALAEKYGFVIIENEISRALVPDPPPLLSSIAPERCYLVASVSKIVAAGLRACFVVCPPDSVNQLKYAVHETVEMVSPLLLEILTLWMKDGTVDSTISRRRTEATRRQILFKEIIGSRYNANTNPYSYFAWLLLPGNWSSLRFAAEARARGVLISPAEDFVLEKCKPANAVRICLGACTNHDSLQKALITLADILDNSGRLNATRI